MAQNKLTKEEKQAELIKYRNLVSAVIDYNIETKVLQIKTADFDSVQYLKGLQGQLDEHFQKGRLTLLKQWFRDFTEVFIETEDFKLNKYLQDKTGYNINIFSSYFKHIEKIIAKGRITSVNQYYDVKNMLDQLCQTQPLDQNKIDILAKLLNDFENQ